MRGALLITLALILVSGCASDSDILPDDRWTPTPLKDFESRIKLKELWSRDFGTVDAEKFVRLVPALDGDTLYVADSNGKITAYEANNGKKIWRVRLKRDVTGAMGAGDNRLFVGTSEGKVFALAEGDGSVQWKASVSSEVLAPPVEADGVVVVQTIDGRVYGLSSKDGGMVWVQQRNEPALSLRGTATPVIYRGLVITGFANGSLGAFVLGDGRQLWDMPVGQPHGRNEIERLIDVDMRPLVDNGVLYVGSYQGNIVAIDLRTGKTRWSRDISSYTGLAAYLGRLYVTDDRGQVIALDRLTGSVMWRQPALKGRQLNAPTIVGGYLVVGDFEGYTHWLDPASGEFVARYRISRNPIRAPIVVRDDIAYVTSVDGELAALHVM